MNLYSGHDLYGGLLYDGGLFEANGNDLVENANDDGGLKKNSLFSDLFLRRAFEHCRVLAL